ncbi:H-NS family nucleoid-associated regulatory protein [Burkholderia ubonensis]|uniref:H-NS histone family protein n=1 Tax=Burkholderia ubonensis TaxID=101571 RepID=UPI000A5E4A88|nr:H-NS histone family protein [Burkholderia ubonensis]
MSTYRELIAKRAQLEAELEAARTTERKFALLEIKRLMEEFSITFVEVRDICMPTKKTLAPRYWNPETGETWAGRGRLPRWLIGKDPDAFRLPSDAQTVGYEQKD